MYLLDRVLVDDFAYFLFAVCELVAHFLILHSGGHTALYALNESLQHRSDISFIIARPSRKQLVCCVIITRKVQHTKLVMCRQCRKYELHVHVDHNEFIGLVCV